MVTTHDKNPKERKKNVLQKVDTTWYLFCLQANLCYNIIKIMCSGRKYNLKIREIIKLIEKDGWHVVRQKGSHRQFKHPEKIGRVTIAGNLNDDLAPGTLNSVLKQAGLKGRE